MAKKTKFYVVWEGLRTGVFDSWTECKASIQGYPNARYKAFTNKDEAEAAYKGNFNDFYSSKTTPKSARPLTEFADEIEWDSLCVDAACSGNPGDLEYRAVDTKTADEFFRKGPFKKGTNNIGEFLALVHALALLHKQGNNSKTIYTDSKTAMSWVKHKRVKTSLKFSAVNADLKNLIKRAEYWLNTHSYSNPVIKWDTKRWGEIPADFGRK